jgi:choline dehydrogenase-like flavoprotein
MQVQVLADVAVAQSRAAQQRRGLDRAAADDDRTRADGDAVAVDRMRLDPARRAVLDDRLRGTRADEDPRPGRGGVGALLRDRDPGEVRIGRDGEPIVRYRLSDFDRANLRTGLDGAAQILEAAGARRIFSSHSAWVSYDPGVDGDRDRFMRAADACGYGPGQVSLASFHIMGTARMGGTPSTSAVNPAGETWDVRDLVVCDASAFPSASGVNPMISIEAIAHMNSSALAARLA